MDSSHLGSRGLVAFFWDFVLLPRPNATVSAGSGIRNPGSVRLLLLTESLAKLLTTLTTRQHRSIGIMLFHVTVVVVAVRCVFRHARWAWRELLLPAAGLRPGQHKFGRVAPGLALTI